MKQKLGRKLLGVLLALAMVIGLMPGMSLTAYAKSEVKYLDASGAEQSITNYTVVESDTKNLRQSWYVVNSDVTINETVQISTDVNLILCDGAKLTVNSSRGDGISATRGSLTIYAQSTSDNMGKLEVTSTGYGIRLMKNLTINGGKIETQGSNGIICQDADITINGGNVTADGGIFFSTPNNLTITGGKVIASATGTDSGIYTEGEVIISGGNVSVTGDENPAIEGTVKNSIAGTGWTNNAGTEGKADIAISTGQTLYYKKVQFPAAASHTHNFTYSSDGAVITATCSASGCTLTDNKATLTIEKPTLTTYGETGKSAAATLTGLDTFNSATSKAIAATNIMYVGRDGTEYTESTTAPTNAGKYTATITLSGVKTAEGDDKSVAASVDYSIKYAVTFNTNGGSAVPQQLVEAGESATRPTDPTREGNIFGGWFADADFARRYVFDEVTENTTVYAKWGEHRVTWTVGEYSLQDVFTGNAPAADSNTMVNFAAEINKPEGATFEGWKTETDVSGDVTHTAQFSFPVTLNVNGGTINAGNVESYIYGTGATLPTDVTRAKYDFGGWFDNSGLTGTAVTQIGTTATGSKEFWAKWTEVYAVPATVTANSRTYDGTEKPLVTVTGTATGGEMQYALGTATEATQPYTTSIPTGTEAGTYYVWYMVKGDDNHANTDPARVQDPISIAPADKSELNAAIASAEAYYDSIKDNAAYADIAATLKKALDAAKAVAGNDNATKDAVAGMVSEVGNAANKARDDVAAVDKQAAEEEAAKKAAEEEAAKQAADEAAAKAVTDKINALPENAGAGDKAAVEAARAAYEALTEDQKKLVPDDALSRLAAAEQQVAAAGEASETVKISDCKIRVKNLAYTGKRIKKPTVTVTYNGQKLKEGTDYTFTYNKKAKAIGEHIVIVKGKGRFTGSKKVTLKVVPKGTAFSKVAGGDKRVFLKWKSQKNITGYQIDYSLKKDFSDRKRVTIKKAKMPTQTPTKIIKKLKAGTTYYVRIRTYTRVKKKSYYSAWSKVKTVKTRAGRAGNESVEPEVETGIDGGDLSLEIDEISIDEISIDEAIPGDGGTVDGGEVTVDEAVEVTVE